MAAFRQGQLQDSETYLRWRRERLLAEIAQLKQQLKTLTNSDLAHSRLSRQLQEAQQQLAEVRQSLYVRRTLSARQQD